MTDHELTEADLFCDGCHKPHNECECDTRLTIPLPPGRKRSGDRETEEKISKAIMQVQI